MELAFSAKSLTPDEQQVIENSHPGTVRILSSDDTGTMVHLHNVDFFDVKLKEVMPPLRQAFTDVLQAR